ncbi:MAG TPA: ATP-binding cassette domain-containing protein [Clostridia bacterium]|nr:ATP-binding cassette domain-containing protein [Clostridia bacterium]
MLRIDGVSKVFNPSTIDETVLFDNYSMSVNKGEFISIIGSNGSGKTTLLNLICGSTNADSGKIIFQNKDISKMSEHKRAHKIGRVFQDPKTGTCSNLTILENMALADNKNRLYGLSIGVNKKRTSYYQSLLECCEMGLENRLGVQVGTLSGGQRQALALVIASMTDIELLILDEHTAALDPKSSETIMKLTQRLVKEKRVTTMMVTHNLRFATQYGDRLIMMHEGKNIVDISGEEKQQTDINSILKVFNEISIEVGN